MGLSSTTVRLRNIWKGRKSSVQEFTKQRFLRLPVAQQHKKCAELLRRMYDSFLKNEITYTEEYADRCRWMNFPALPLISGEAISNAYHEHLKAANIQLKEHNLLPTIRHQDRQHAEELWPIAIFLDHIRSAHNVGSIVRTTEALSLGKLYFSKDTPYIDNKQVKDTSMGAEEWIICGKAVLNDLPKPIIAMETSDASIPLHDFIFPGSFTLVLGNEEYGCSEDSLRKADHLIEIPLRGRKNSLNVANAFAIAAAEISRQKRISS